MIKNLQIRLNCDKRGKITSGLKTEKGFPKAVDYFVCDEFPEIIQEYGKQPKKIIIAFPVNDINSLFDCNYVLYGGNQTKIRQCDGENCIHRIDEELNGIKYRGGEESKCVCDDLDDDKKRCHAIMYLKAWILKKDGGLLSPSVYLFQSGSENSAANIFGELEKVRFLNSEILQHIPFGLSVDMVSSRDEAKKRFPIWSLQAIPRNQLGGKIEFQLPSRKEATERLLEPSKAEPQTDKILLAISELKVGNKDKFRMIDDELSAVEDLQKRKMYVETFEKKLMAIGSDYEIETMLF